MLWASDISVAASIAVRAIAHVNSIGQHVAMSRSCLSKIAINACTLSSCFSVGLRLNNSSNPIGFILPVSAVWLACRVSSRLVRSGQVPSGLVPSRSDGSCRVVSGPVSSRLVMSCPVWSRLGQLVRVWSCLVQSCRVWSSRVASRPVLSRRGQLVRVLSCQVLSRLVASRLVRSGPVLSRRENTLTQPSRLSRPTSPR